MIKRMKTKQGYVLVRIHSKLGEIITWDILTNDAKSRIGVVRQLNDPWMSKRFGWQSFPIKFWFASLFYSQLHLVGKTRESILNQLTSIRKP
jgi:hypothetical protein